MSLFLPVCNLSTLARVWQIMDTHNRLVESCQLNPPKVLLGMEADGFSSDGWAGGSLLRAHPRTFSMRSSSLALPAVRCAHPLSCFLSRSASFFTTAFISMQEPSTLHPKAARSQVHLSSTLPQVSAVLPSAVIWIIKVPGRPMD